MKLHGIKIKSFSSSGLIAMIQRKVFNKLQRDNYVQASSNAHEVHLIFYVVELINPQSYDLTAEKIKVPFRAYKNTKLEEQFYFTATRSRYGSVCG